VKGKMKEERLKRKVTAQAFEITFLFLAQKPSPVLTLQQHLLASTAAPVLIPGTHLTGGIAGGPDALRALVASWPHTSTLRAWADDGLFALSLLLLFSGLSP
jgi:hypothetical protein